MVFAIVSQQQCFFAQLLRNGCLLRLTFLFPDQVSLIIHNLGLYPLIVSPNLPPDISDLLHLYVQPRGLFLSSKYLLVCCRNTNLD